MIRALSLTCGLLLTAACQPAPTRTELCTQTVLDYAVLRDNGPAEDYAALFTADGTFTLGPNVTAGHNALIARHTSANAAALWRHNMVDVRIEDSGDGLSGQSRFIIYTAPHPAPAQAPREIIGDYIDTFRVENGVCKIASRSVKIIFDTPAGLRPKTE